MKKLLKQKVKTLKKKSVDDPESPKKESIDSTSSFIKECGDDYLKEFNVQVMSEDSEAFCPYRISFKHKGLQAITGGIPGGHFTEISGISGCGKSYLLYELGGQTISMGGFFLIHDPERAYETSYGRRTGLVTGGNRFLYSKEYLLEKVFVLSRRFILDTRKKFPDAPILVGIDSYPPLRTFMSEEETEEQLKKGAKEFKGYREAKKNATFSNIIGEFTTFLSDQKATLVLINQTKQKIGVVFGDSQTVNADNVIQYPTTLRIRGKLGSKILDPKTGRRIGVISRWETTKNRDTSPWKDVETKILYKDGIDEFSGLRDLFVAEGIGDAIKGKPNGILYKNKEYEVERLIKKKPSLLDLSERV